MPFLSAQTKTNPCARLMPANPKAARHPSRIAAMRMSTMCPLYGADRTPPLVNEAIPNITQNPTSDTIAPSLTWPRRTQASTAICSANSGTRKISRAMS